jgi:hypothetical protein
MMAHRFARVLVNSIKTNRIRIMNINTLRQFTAAASESTPPTKVYYTDRILLISLEEALLI